MVAAWHYGRVITFQLAAGPWFGSLHQ
jgi:hypothetical protein